MKVVFVGSHPDDIEIGAGTLAYRLTRDQHEVYFLVLSDDDSSESRRAEAVASAEVLGVPRSRVLFAGFQDGHLIADRESIAVVRSIVSESIGQPDVVVAHTAADSHNDHAQGNQLARSVFRRTVLLFYSIHISAEVMRFAPRVYSTVDPIKDESLALHRSQSARIGKADLREHEARLGRPVRLARAEAFELEFQAGADWESLNRILAYNSSPFHTLWTPLIGNDQVYLIHEAYDNTYPVFADETDGRVELRDAFLGFWFPYIKQGTPIIEKLSNDKAAAQLFQTQHAVLAGGAVSNLVYRNIFVRFQEVDWVIDYSLPGPENVFVREKSTGRQIRASKPGGRTGKDLAIFTLMRNPYDIRKWCISCAGIRGLGTRGLLHFLADPASIPELFDSVKSSVADGFALQALVYIKRDGMRGDVADIAKVRQ